MSESSRLLNILRTRLKEIFDLERRLRALLARLNGAEFPGAPHAATHSDGGADEVAVTNLGGFPGGGTTFLRDDGTFAATPAGTPSATVAALDGTGSAGASTDYSRGDHKHADANRPTDDQKAALAGTSGAPSNTNRYVTDADARNTNARTPSAHAASHQNGGGDEINVGGLSGVLADPQTVDTDAAGALDGDGSVGSPLAVRVDGSTIIINGSNELEVVGSVAGSPAAGSPGNPLEGVEYPIKFTLDGAGADISTGVKNYTALIPPVGYDGQITEWNLYSPIAGDIVINVRKNGASITGGNDAALSADDEATDTTLSNWPGRNIVGGDRLSINVLSCSGIEFAELQMIVVRT